VAFLTAHVNMLVGDNQQFCCCLFICSSIRASEHIIQRR